MNNIYHCSFLDHSDEPITGCCLNLECQNKFQVCMLCIKQKHDNHKSDCKSFAQIKSFISNQTSLITEWQKKIDDEFLKIQKLYSISGKFLESERNRLNELEQNLKTNNFNEFNSNFTSLKNWYNIALIKQRIIFDDLLGKIQFTYSDSLHQLKNLSETFTKSYQNKNNEIISQQQEIIQQVDESVKISEELFEKGNQKLFQGLQCKIQKDLPNALKYFDSAIQVNPKNEMFFLHKGLMLMELIRTEAALKCFEDGLQINPKQLELLNSKGAALQNLNRFEDAVKFYNQALLVNPNFTEGFNNKGMLNPKLGYALYSLNRFEEAIRCFDQAISLDKTFAKSYNNKGLALNSLTKYKDAIKCFDQALAIDPKYTKALNNKGLALHRSERYEEALKCYDQAIQYDPTDPDPYSNKGFVLDILNRFEEAIKQYDKAISLNPLFACAFNNKGYALTRLGKFSESITCYQKALEINPKDPNIYEGMGKNYNIIAISLQILGKMEESQKCLKMAKDIRRKKR